jgi:hypothetical protein
MKKNCSTIQSTILAMLVVLLCSVMVQAKVVSESQAAMIAKRLMHIQGKTLVRKHQIKASTSAQSPYYIFTGNDGKGFVIISADDIARPVLGYSTDAELTPDGALPLPMEQWLASMGSQIRQAQENGIQQSAEVADQWDESSMGSIVVKLQTAEWGQRAPFNDQCPLDGDERSFTGCVPMAYAILMRYYKYPQAGKGNTQAYVTESNGLSVASRNLEHTYDWDNMPLTYTSEEYSTTQANNVATLLADIGAAIQVNYSSNGTGGWPGRGELFSKFDYYPGTTRLKDLYTAGEWDEMMRKELDMNRPIIYTAEDTDAEGHCFLLDGYTEDGYFSVNWGWSGKYNGFFTLDALTPADIFYKSEHAAYLNTVPMPSSDADFVVEKNGQPYPTLTAAICESSIDETPTTINLLADVQEQSFHNLAGKTITLNIGNHSIDVLTGFYNYGNLTVNGTENSHVTTIGNHAVFSNYGEMEIKGGSYINTCPAVDSTDYRRCVWTNEGSKTNISDVTFEAPGQVICSNGDLTIESGSFTGTGNSAVVRNTATSNMLVIRGGTFTNNGNGAVISNASTIGTLTIEGGTFINNCTEVSGTDYRRAVWTTEGSNTYISDGTFQSPGQVICSNGDLTIESGSFTGIGNSAVVRNTATSNIFTIRGGTFTNTGNNAVVYNYSTIGTLTIEGGTFLNNCVDVSGTDYRRCLWTTQDSKTYIGKASFTNEYGSQTLCFNGDATINGADINNVNGYYGCLAFSSAIVVIDDCKLSAPDLFYMDDDAQIICRGGLYSDIVDPEFLAEGYECVPNTQKETRRDYPYMVKEDPTDIESPMAQEEVHEMQFYNIQGMPQPSLQRGVNLVRCSDGTIRKILNK